MPHPCKHLNTIRVDCLGLDPDVVKDDILQYIYLIHKKKDKVYPYKWYIQLEEGDETGKLHWQGWIEHETPTCGNKDPRDAFRERMNKSINGLSPEHKKSSSKSFAKIKDFEKICSYHLRNPSKDIAEENISTNYTSEELDGFSQCPEWIVSKKKVNLDKNDWFAITLRELENFCIYTDITGFKRINYPVIPKFVLKRIPKNLDFIIFSRLVLGLTNKLEEKYDNKFNRRVESNFLDKIFNEYSEIYKMSNFD